MKLEKGKSAPGAGAQNLREVVRSMLSIYVSLVCRPHLSLEKHESLSKALKLSIPQFQIFERGREKLFNRIVMRITYEPGT